MTDLDLDTLQAAASGEWTATVEMPAPTTLALIAEVRDSRARIAEVEAERAAAMTEANRQNALMLTVQDERDEALVSIAEHKACIADMRRRKEAAEQKVAALAEVIERIGQSLASFHASDGTAASVILLVGRLEGALSLVPAPTPPAEAEEVPAICEHGYFGPHQTPLLADDMPDGSTRHAGWTTCPGPTPPTTDAEEARDV